MNIVHIIYAVDTYICVYTYMYIDKVKNIAFLAIRAHFVYRKHRSPDKQCAAV